jgi:cell wall-associated NlpC family hydrolase
MVIRWVLRCVLTVVLAVTVASGLAPEAPAATASTTPARLLALRWAEAQAGKWYCWAGSGPACFDCSGLVMAAYAHGAGIWLPHSTYAMLASRHLRWEPASSRRRGDLAFYGSGHVELVTFGGTFGALMTGFPVGWHHPSAWWHPTAYYRVVR